MKIRIQNFRSLKDTDWVDIKPITILIGKNSAGKSSFLRHFPMLKQSFEEKTKVPLLFYGRYVDFGSYKDIKPSYTNDNYKFGIKFTLNEKQIKRTFRLNRFFNDLNLINLKDNEFEVNMTFIEDKKGLVHVLKLNMKVFNNKIELLLNNKYNTIENILFNNNPLDIGIDFKNFKFIERNGFIPDFYFFPDENKEENIFISRRMEVFFEKEIEQFIKKYNRKNTSWFTLEEIKEKINIFDFENSLKNKSFPKTWIKHIKKLEKENNLELKKLYKLYVLRNVFLLMPMVNDYISLIFRKSSYIAPLRATAERYYRIQHLSIEEVDPNGKNLPFFLDSLTDTQMKHFQDWTFKNFNFKIHISKIEGHYSIKIEENEKLINLSDMGFGYSQILPIIVQLWYSAFYEYKRMGLINRVKEKIIVIEQPELHLHPKFQGLFAEVLAKLIKDSKRLELKIIIETHSDTIINRLGDCILSNIISKDDINIVIFDKEFSDNFSKIKQLSFNEDGEINEWPLGFFIANEGCL